MLFDQSYEFLKDSLIGKIMIIDDLNIIVSKTDCFDNIIDNYFLSNCIIQENKQCSFNSNQNDKGTHVINIDLSFSNVSDFEIIKKMSWSDNSGRNNISIKIENVYLYDLHV
jgi:hypothetical protein